MHVMVVAQNVDGWVDMDGWWIDGWVDGWMDGWIDGWCVLYSYRARMRDFRIESLRVARACYLLTNRVNVMHSYPTQYVYHNSENKKDLLSLIITVRMIYCSYCINNILISHA